MYITSKCLRTEQFLIKVVKTISKQTLRIFICGISIYAWIQIIGFGLIQPKWEPSTGLFYRGSQSKHPLIADEVCREHLKGLVANNSTYASGYRILNSSIYYCNIPKCGSTFMGMFLKKVFSKDKKYNTTELMFKIKETQHIEDAYAFMFVREPYSRLFSAYENKFFHPSEMWSTLGTEVIREVRENASFFSKQTGHDVSFRELVDYVVRLHEQGRHMNLHLAPMHTLCNPCKQRFDFIGKLETMTADLVLLAREWRSRGLISVENKVIEDVELETKYTRSFGRVGHMFWIVREYKHLQKYRLFLRTWSSYQIRGLILKKYKMPFSKVMASNVNKELYKLAVNSAMYASSRYGTELKAQRKEALMQAYRTVPVELLHKLRNVVVSDCLLFGYDERPKIIFNRSALTSVNGHDYFNGL